MKIFKLFALAGVAFLIGACSNGNDINSKLDAYEAAMDEYVEAIQKQINNAQSDDPKAGIEMIETANNFLEKTKNMSEELEKLKGEMTAEQQQRLLQITLKATTATVPADQKEAIENLSNSLGLGN